MSHCIAFILPCFRHMTTNCIIKAAADQSMIHHIEHCSKKKNEDSAYCHARAITANGTIAVVIHRILCHNFIVLSHFAINIRLENHHVSYCSLSVKNFLKSNIPSPADVCNCGKAIFCIYRGVLRRLRQGSSKWQRAAQKPL